MIRKSNHKFITTKASGASEKYDMLFNLDDDPHEMTNLLGMNGLERASDTEIAKAEHLKVLLEEWMLRNDGMERYYSDSKWDLRNGDGDVAVVRSRRTWRKLDFWISDRVLKFGTPILKENVYVRNEYLYVGRTSSGHMRIKEMHITGDDEHYFEICEVLVSGGYGTSEQRYTNFDDVPKPLSVRKDCYVRVKVCFVAPSFKDNIRKKLAGVNDDLIIRRNDQSALELIPVMMTGQQKQMASSPSTEGIPETDEAT